MSVWKKVLAGVVVTALVAGAGAGGLNYMKKSRIKEVTVVSVDSLASDYYMEDTTLDGNITTNVSQKVTMDKDMVVDQLYVSQGDAVKVGDPLVSFDMTLVNMELEIAKLKQQQLEVDLTKAQRRLTSLRNGGPIVEDTTGTGTDRLSDLSDENLASVQVLNDGKLMAAVIHPFFLAFTGDFDGDGTVTIPVETGSTDHTSDSGDHADTGNTSDTGEVSDPGTVSDTGDVPDTGDTGSGTGEQQEADPSPAPSDASSENDGQTPDDPSGTEPSDSGDSTAPEAADGSAPEDAEGGSEDDFSPDDSDFEYLHPGFHLILDDTTEPYTGTGTEEDPFLFLCSSATGEVTAMGTFLNKMAGFSADGAKVLHEGGYWYLLEFHENDTIADTRHREDSCTGYYLIDGGILEEPVSMFAEVVYTLEDALHYQEEEPEDPYLPGGDTDPDLSTMTRQEAIKAQETKVRALELDIEEGLINIRKLEKKAENEVVYSRLDGTIAAVGDPVTGSTASNGTFLTVKSKEGFYVKGNVSELMLDQVSVGTKLNCMSYSTGDFSAQIVDVSDYPEASTDRYYFGGDSNPNVSYYSFSASIDDQSLDLMDGDWIQITLKTDASKSGKLVISKAFVRSENGMNYVYKDEDGVLKKQYIKVGETVDGGYSVMILGGISRKDLIAFPYGDAKEGVLTKKGTEEDLY